MTSTAAPAAPFRSPAPAREAAPVFDSAAIRAIEQANAGIDLMRRAGKAAADFLRARTTPDARVLLVAGPGNNGGDAFACAVELAAAGYAPELVMLGDPARLPEDAREAWERLSTFAAPMTGALAPPAPSPMATTSGAVADRVPDGSDLIDSATAFLAGENGLDGSPFGAPRQSFQSSKGRIRLAMGFESAALAGDWIVDGLFGIGLTRPLEGVYAEAVGRIAQARAAGARVLALDTPSGVDADTGGLVGDHAVVADHTLSFIALKPGLLTGPALDHVGQVHCDTLGLDLARLASPIACFALADARAQLRPAQANAHKGTHGTLTIVGGASGMLGAALLAGRAAMRMGAGKVRVTWLAEPHPEVDWLMPELMMRSAADLASDDAGALVIGCGMGTSGAAVRVLRSQLQRAVPMVIDADALNLIAQSADLAVLLQQRGAATVITPHPAEAARLLGASTASVQGDRLRAARDLATGYRCIVALKGAGTVVADGQRLSINATGNPLLATAGTGDVLAGMIGALLARGHDGFGAAQIGVALHGAAADALAARGIQRAVAGDIVAELAVL